jgi:hypothetical protein
MTKKNIIGMLRWELSTVKHVMNKKLNEDPACDIMYLRGQEVVLTTMLSMIEKGKGTYVPDEYLK